jgi:hypothetical protein
LRFVDIHKLTPHMRPASGVGYLSIGIDPVKARIPIRLQHPFEVL